MGSEFVRQRAPVGYVSSLFVLETEQVSCSAGDWIAKGNPQCNAYFRADQDAAHSLSQRPAQGRGLQHLGVTLRL